MKSATHTAVKLSHLAYEGFTLELEERIAATGCGNVHFLVNGPSHAFTAEQGDDVYAVFRGTGIRDKISLRQYVKIWFQLVVEGAGRVHSRYQRALDRVWEFGMQPKLAEYAGRRIIFTGHSLGAGMAVLAAGRYLQANSAAAAAVIVFGCPRIGDKNYGKNFPIAINRWVNGNDIIQYIPPPMPFLHFGIKHHLIRGILKHPRNTAAEFLCSCYALTRKNLWRNMLTDHHSWSYVKAVAEWARQSEAGVEPLSTDGLGTN